MKLLVGCRPNKRLHLTIASVTRRAGHVSRQPRLQVKLSRYMEWAESAYTKIFEICLLVIPSAISALRSKSTLTDGSPRSIFAIRD
jgi:hypothetical protein